MGNDKSLSHQVEGKGIKTNQSPQEREGAMRVEEVPAAMCSGDYEQFIFGLRIIQKVKTKTTKHFALMHGKIRQHNFERPLSSRVIDQTFVPTSIVSVPLTFQRLSAWSWPFRRPCFLS